VEEKERMSNLETKNIVFKHDNETIIPESNKTIKSELTDDKNKVEEFDKKDAENFNNISLKEIATDEIVKKTELEMNEEQDTPKISSEKLECPSCSNTIQVDDFFCENCGYKLKK